MFVQFFYVGYQVILTKITDERNRAKLIGFFGTLTGLISSPGPYIGMYLKIKYGFTATFQLCLLFSIISLFFLYRTKTAETFPSRSLPC